LVTFFRRIRQNRSSHQISSTIRTFSQLRGDETSSTTTSALVPKKKRSPILFPWWCLFIAYGLSYILIVICLVLIIARGIEFGDTKVRKWLTSMITGFFSSVLLSQPIKVCLYRTILMN
jgi:hypothetical protein